MAAPEYIINLRKSLQLGFWRI